uniref:Uncharacterized protein n=1 Tax=Leptobrachium leishanense TaxID=445787 RepID=A0A8C5PVJ4_9ANUR
HPRHPSQWHLSDEVTCAICLNIYIDPVTLPCGQSFCRTCIGAVLDTQGMSGYSCPECREMFSKKPDLKRNLRLNNRELPNRKCSVHKKVLEYYCCEDAACICVSCRLDGEHRGHQVEALSEASEKKEKLRNIGVTEGVTALIKDIRKQLKALEKRVLKEISRQEELASLRVSNLIRQLEIKKEELTKKMGDIEEICDMTDPVTVLQGRESGRADYCDTEKHDIKVLDVGDLDVGQISVTLHTGLAEILTRISMGVNTALFINKAEMPRNTREISGFPQVLSSRSFSSGRHYWEVEVSESGGWVVGMAYPSIERRGWQSLVGENNKSWSLFRWDYNQYSVIHDSNVILLPDLPSCGRLWIFLDYEAGRLSFFELCDPIRHLHTFTAAFTEPLHAVFGVYGYNYWVRI